MHRLRCGVVILALLAASAAWSAEAPDLSGAELYQLFCASCHGVKAHGDGPVARSLKPKVPDLTRIAQRNGGVYPADKVERIVDGRDLRVAHGTADMPVWGWEFYAYKYEDPERRIHVKQLIDRLVAYLASVQR